MMSILLKADIPQGVPFVAVPPTTRGASSYRIPDASAAGAPPVDLAEFEFAASSGGVGTLNVDVSAPNIWDPDVRVAPYMEADTDDATQRWSFPQITAGQTPTPLSLAFPEFPEGTKKARLGFELREPASGSVLYTNEFDNPRGASSDGFGTRYSWPLSSQTSVSDLPMQAGLKTYAQVQCHSAATGTGRGINLFQSTDGGTPNPSLDGVYVGDWTGTAFTVSGYVYSTKAGTMQASARCFRDTTWTAAATNGTASAITANTWTRFSVTITIPAASNSLCATFMMTSSVAWVVGDQIRLSAVQVERAAAASTYFDGDSPDTTNYGYRWDPIPNNSPSTRFDRSPVTLVYRTNLLTNPSFETDTAGWSATHAVFSGSGTAPASTVSRITPGGYVGSCYARRVLSSVGGYLVSNLGLGASSRVLLTEGDTYTVSAWVRANAGDTVHIAAGLYAASSGGTGTVFTGSAARTGDWQRISKTFTVPVGSPYVEVTTDVVASVAEAPLLAGTTLDVDGAMLEKASTVNSYFDGSIDGSIDTGVDFSARWTGTAHASSSELYAAGVAKGDPTRRLVFTNLTMSIQAGADEIIGASLNRSLRRSVFDALNEEAPQIAVGTPSLLAGSITYLCSTLEHALALDSVYQFAGEITLLTGTGVALDGFKHMAVEELRIDAERALPGRPAKWLVRADVREIK